MTNKEYRIKNKVRLAKLRKLRESKPEVKAKIRAYSVAYHENPDNYLKYMVERARTRNAGQQPFDIDFDFVRQQMRKQRGRCYYSGLKLVIKRGLGSKGSRNRLAPSLERIDNTKGYTRDNTVIVCIHANKAKLNFSLEDLLDLSKRMARRLPKIIRERNEK